jgi:hypothetical protein
MRKAFIVGATLAVIGGSALAQNQTPPAQQGPGNRAINTEGVNNFKRTRRWSQQLY